MKLKVTFLPEGRVIPALPGMSVLDLAREANIALVAHCGGSGTCGKCRVIVEPAPEPTSLEKKVIPAAQLKKGCRLACRLRPGKSDLVVTVPPGSRFLNLKSLNTVLEREITIDHPVRKYFLRLEKPTIEDQLPDWERLRSALSDTSASEPGEICIALPVLRRLPELARENDFCLTATMSGHEVIDLEGGDTSGKCFGVALDLGTTSITGVLLDMGNAAEKAVVDRANPQVSFGADVISRINHTIENAEGLKRLSETAAGALDEMISDLCRKAGVSAAHVYQVVVAGNTVMEHLLARLPSFPLAGSPYVGVHRSPLECPAAEIGLRVPVNARVYLAPLVSGYVGGDAVAGVLACNQHREKKKRLFVDIGTNGEIVAGGSDGLWCAAAAAGPAFEGATIRRGMRAEPGAMDKVRLRDGVVEYTTIDEQPALGICGTGLVGAVSEMLRLGIVTPVGRLLSGSELEGESKNYAGCLGEEKGERFFRLCPETGVALYQGDIRQLQLAKAAIATGIEILLKKAGLKVSELEEIILAGAFGSYIEPHDALRIGLLPPESDLSRIVFAGNTALLGARMLLLSDAARREASVISRLCRCVELFHEPGFMDCYSDHMLFPGGAPASPGPGSR